MAQIAAAEAGQAALRVELQHVRATAASALEDKEGTVQRYHGRWLQANTARMQMEQQRDELQQLLDAFKASHEEARLALEWKVTLLQSQLRTYQGSPSPSQPPSEVLMLEEEDD
jgi:hypothetical protein